MNKRRERERERRGAVMVCVVVHLVDHLNKKPFRPLYIFKHVQKNNCVLFISKNMITTGLKFQVYSTVIR
jgi:hypothetical protein